MYGKSSKYYDIAFANKDYQRESKFLHEHAKDKGINASKLLNLACGTGSHEQYFSEIPEIHGLDFNKEFIDIAMRKNPSVSYHLGDMTDFKLNERFDIITCLFSSIANLESISALKKMVGCSVEHMNRNGIFIIEPFFEPHEWINNLMFMKTFDTDDYKYSIISKSQLKDGKGIGKEVHTYLDKSGFDVFEEDFIFSLFKQEDIKNIFIEYKLEYIFIKNEIFTRGLHIGILR